MTARALTKPAKTASVRLRQGLAFAVGALVLALVLGDDPTRFTLVPIVLGTTYLVAAALGGRDGGHWSSACVLLGWGAAVLAVREGWIDRDTAALYLAGAGLGGLAAAGLERAGFTADLLGVAATTTLAGLAFAFEPDVEALGEARTYAIALGVVALVNLALTLRR